MIKGVVLDLDGTVYLGSKPVDGAAEFVTYLRERSVRTLFVTNRANRLPQQVADQLISMGIPCSADDILTSSQATAQYLEPGRAYMIGETGLETALLERGFTITDNSVRYVIVSFDRTFNYQKMHIAANLIYGGAEFIATNPDRALPTADGIQPGTGAIVAAIETICAKPPVYIGKPEPLIMQMAAQKLDLDPSEVLAIGDNIATDIPSGRRAGMLTALIMTGISSQSDVEKSPTKPDHQAADYRTLTNVLSTLIQLHRRLILNIDKAGFQE